MSEFVFCETTQFLTQLLASYYYTVTLNDPLSPLNYCLFFHLFMELFQLFYHQNLNVQDGF